jgi:hypothetical protein
VADMPERSREPGDYRSYLLRLWRAGDRENPVWRAWLKSARTGEQVGFGSLEELFEFLRRETELAGDRDGD